MKDDHHHTKNYTKATTATSEMEKLAAANQNLTKAHESRENDYTTEINKLEAKEKQLMDRLKLLDEKKFKVALSNGDVDVADEDLVEINAGGKVIAVSRSTLTQFKGTKLEALFSGRWDKIMVRDSSGRIFLDVNPVCFQAIVDYLNEVKISTEENPAAPPSALSISTFLCNSLIYSVYLMFFFLLNYRIARLLKKLSRNASSRLA